MCGRFSLAPDESREIARIVAEVQSRFGSDSIRTGEIFPTNAVPILLAEGQEMAPKPMTWGFPSFSGKGIIINARGETAPDKPMFRRSLLERRCVVPTTGFYEWDRKKTKYRFRLPGRNRLYLAGLWNAFQGEERFVILTTAPNDTIINVHDRMPVLLTDDEVAPWLHDTGMASAKLTAIQPALEHVAV
ncbi:MAG: SOS response-associated peptidase [Oscillospiraceae bacterium]|nr:SOS response-associated peptidase [Oscillospiraceae bacterium]